MDARKMVIGSVIGGAVGAVAATLFASKSTRKRFADRVEEYSDRLKSVVNGVSNFDVSEVVETIKDQIEELPDLDNKDFLKGVAVGALLGAVVGSGACMLMNDRTGSNGAFITSMAKKFVNVMNNTAETAKKTGAAAENLTDDILDFAHAGMKCWNKFKK